MPRYFLFFVFGSFAALLYSSSAQTLQNPILFVTVVPNARDSASQTAVFSSHLAGVRNAPRGGDLWIRYPNGSLKNLTQLAGYGNEGVQAEKSIAVREPNVHWNGQKAIFSMIEGSPISTNDSKKYYWQLYEITGLGQNDTPVITKVPNQPEANNVSPTYGTDGRIIFVSDRRRLGNTGDYPYLDENITMVTNSGIWSLNPVNGDLRLLDHSPSGSFSPIVDSYGRVLFSRWDFLQQDQINSNSMMRVDFGNENNNNSYAMNTSQAEFPENNPFIQTIPTASYYTPPTDTTPPSLLVDAHCPSNFFPWSVNEDGSNAQTINHIGRHDLLTAIPAVDAAKSDPNLKAFAEVLSPRANKYPIINCINMREDPNAPGVLYAVDAVPALNHAGGQIIRLNKVAPTDASSAVTVNYITPRATRSIVPLKAPDPNHTGYYRTPLPTTSGVLVASHSTTLTIDQIPADGAINVNSRHNYRLKTLKLDGEFMIPDQYLTSGIRKSLTIKDYTVASSQRTIEFDGLLWEMDPVEVVARQTPAQRTEAAIDPLEQAVFNEENVDVGTFRSYLVKNDKALIVSRDITMRDKDDKQQPFYLRVAGTNKQTAGTSGKVYDVSHLTLFQADYLRGYKSTRTQVEVKGRRVLPTRMHDGSATNGNTKIEKDGSFAVIVPAQRSLTWQLSDPSGKAVVRERYWVTFKAGEIRACVKCHGENGEASVLSSPTPQNESEGLRSLLRAWKTENYPSRVKLTLPLHQSLNNVFPVNLQWQADAKAQKYEIIVKAFEGNQLRVVYTKTVDAPTTSLQLQQSDVQTNAKQFQWEVRAIGEWGMSETVSPFHFSTDGVLSVGETGESAELKLEPNPASDVVRIRFSMNEPSPYTIVLTDMLGRDVQVSASGAAEQEVNTELALRGLSDGVYIVRVQYAGGEYRRRLVVSR